MIVYRLARKDRAVLDGKGAAEYPGRWNKEGIPCIYTSCSPSLAQLEVMVNVDDWKIFIAVKYVVLKIEVTDKQIKIFKASDLPIRWDEAAHPPETQEFGSVLLNDPDLLAFSVPSAVSKLENNILINPRAKEFSRVKVVETIDFEFDGRLMR